MSKVTPTAPPVATAPEPWPLSVAGYHALGELGLIPEKTELLYGRVFKKLSKTPLHSFLSQRLLHVLQQLTPPGFLVRHEEPIVCGDSEPEPDVAVIRGREEDFRHSHPSRAELVIEVCVATLEYDRSKLRAYANAGIPECWLILAPERRIEVHRQPANGAFLESGVFGPGGSLACHSVPELRIELPVFFEA